MGVSGKNVRAAVAALVAIPFLLTACSGQESTAPEASSPSASPSAEPTPSPSPSVTVEPSDTLEGIKVTGEVGEDPKIEFTTPMAIDKTRSKVLVPGDGPVVGEGATVEINYRGVLGRTGEEFYNSFSQGRPAVFPIKRTVPGFEKGLVGKKVGDRVLLAIPGVDGYDAAAEAGAAPAGMQVGDTLIFVVDVLATSFEKPTGKPVTPKFDQVKVTTEGIPEATIPSSATPPSELVVQPIIAGVGRKVKAEDAVIVHYRTWSWRTGKLVEDRFDADQIGKLADTIEAWKTGLVGQTTGSRVLLVAPSSLTYPSGNPNISVEAGDTLVYVIDILFASPHLS